MFFCFIVLLINKKLYVDKTITILLLFLFSHSLIGILLGFSTLALLTKISVKIVLFYVVFSSLLKITNKNVKYLIKIYLKICIGISTIGLVAVISYAINFIPGYDFSWLLNSWYFIEKGGFFGLPRAQSILAEPSHVGYTMGAAIFLSLGRLFGNNKSFISLKGSITILTFAFLSASITVYFTFFVAALFTIRLEAKQLLSMIGIGGLISVVFLMIIRPDLSIIQNKIEQTQLIFAEDGQVEGIGGSSYSLYVASLISANTFKNSLGFGGGIGSYEYAYTRLIDEISSNISAGTVGNYQTGSSLFNRMMTELGIFGMALLLKLFHMIITGIRRFKGDNRIIHLALSVAFIPFLVRQGTYQNHGFALFLLLFLSNYQQSMAFYKSRKIGVSKNNTVSQTPANSVTSSNKLG